MLEQIKKFIKNKIINPNFSIIKTSLISFGLGAILVLAFAPFNIIFFAVASLSLFMAIIDEQKNSKKLFYSAFFYCFGFFVFGIYWICNSLLIDFSRYGWLIPFAITLIPALMSIYFTLIIYIYNLLKNYFSISLSYKRILLFSALFTIFEIVRSNLFTDRKSVV